MASTRRAPEPTRDDLLRRRAAFLNGLAQERATFEHSFITRCLEAHIGAGAYCDINGRPPTVDVLLLSGGGDRGAFGTGFLVGWGEVEGELARPRFDCVTGVSTGALIAPYAFVGTNDAYNEIDTSYRNPGPDWARRRLARGVLGLEESLFDNSGLRRYVKNQLRPDFIAAIAEGNARGRKLLIGTTNADTGFMRPWDVSQFATTVHCDGCRDHITDILMASASIPGAFPPVRIDGDVYIDGGVTMQMFLPCAWRMVHEMEGPVRDLQRAGVPLPEIRLWVVMNAVLNPAPASLTTPKWYSVLQRGLDIAIKSTSVVALRDLQLFAALATHQSGVKVSMRYVSIPDSFVDPDEGSDMFDRGTMTRLSDLGRSLGRDPTSWRTSVPAPESGDTYELERPAAREA